MIDKLDADLRFNREALNLRVQRQDVLASNIAHSDTPNYKARDFDFGSRLSQAMAQGRMSQSMSLATTSARHLQGEAQAMPDEDLQYRVPTQSSIDGNTVDMDVERVNFADNAMRYESDLTVISAKIKSLLSAVQQ
jgi:flagellar basal-body rod protein FlgB